MQISKFIVKTALPGFLAVGLFAFFALDAQEKSDSFYGGYYKSDERGNATENFSSRGAVLHIKAQKSRFRRNEDIVVQMELYNNGSYPLTLYMHRNFLLNFTIIARDESGRSIPMQDVYYFKKNRDEQDTFFQNYTATNHHSRAIVLQPAESLNRSIRLQDVIKLDSVFDNSDSGLNEIQIEAFIYFNPEQNKNHFIKSANRLRIFLEKRMFENDYQPNIQTAEGSEAGISPQETVFLALSAEYSGNWSNYFKYVSLDSIIKDFPDYAKLYSQAEGFERGKVIAKFKEYLNDRKSHRLIKFKVLNENFADKEQYQVNFERGITEVRVQASRMLEGFVRDFRYTYFLSRSQMNQSMWLITGVETQVLK